MNQDTDSIELGDDLTPASYRQKAMEQRQTDERAALSRAVRRSRQSGINATIDELNRAGLNRQDLSEGPVSRTVNPHPADLADQGEQLTQLLLDEVATDELDATEADEVAEAIERFLTPPDAA